MVERPLRMREVPWSMPGFSNFLKDNKKINYIYNFDLPIQDLSLLQKLKNRIIEKRKTITVLPHEPQEKKYTEIAKDGDFRVSEDSGDMKSRQESTKLPSIHS